MGKSLTHKISRRPNRDKEDPKAPNSVPDEVISPSKSAQKLKILQKPKKTAGSIKKSRKDKDQQKHDIEELKVLLNLEAPKVDLNMFQSMNLDAAARLKPKKKLSTK